MKYLIILTAILAGCASSGKVVVKEEIKFDELTMMECGNFVETLSGKDVDLLNQAKENGRIYAECKKTNELKLNVLRSLSSK